MTVQISDHYRQLIEQRIAAGEFDTVEEAVYAALDRLTGQDGDFAPGELNRLVAPALEQFERGEGVPLDQAMQAVRERIANKTKGRTSA